MIHPIHIGRGDKSEGGVGGLGSLVHAHINMHKTVRPAHFPCILCILYGAAGVIFLEYDIYFKAFTVRLSGQEI